MVRPKIIAASGTLSIDQAVTRLDEQAGSGNAAIVVGLVRAPNSKCWWVCVARSRFELIWVSAHRLRKEAEAQVAVVEQAAKRGSLTEDVSFAELLEELSANGDEDLRHTLVLAPLPETHLGQRPAVTERLQANQEQAHALRSAALQSLPLTRHRTRAGSADGGVEAAA